MQKFIRFFSLVYLVYASLFFSIGYAGSEYVKDLPAILEKIMPSVVHIAAQGEVAINNPIFEEMFGNRGQKIMRQFESLGSGVIINASKGYIVTNAHVVRDAKVINVTLKDGRIFKAKMIGNDQATDIAILQIKADRLKEISFGNSDKLKVGDFVAAIGSPFQLNQTVTSGIISALQRSNLGIEGYEDFIQTDAAINSGSSGGALVDAQGQLIGINTAILAAGGGNLGIGFAIPINMVKVVMRQLMEHGQVDRGVIGVRSQDFTPALADAFKLANQTSGALVAEVIPGLPAAQAGIKAGDIIQKVNEMAVTNSSQLRNAVGALRAGSNVKIHLLRDGKTMDFSLKNIDPKKQQISNEKNQSFLQGVSLQNFDRQLPVQGRVQGIQILSLDENSVMWRSGLRPGDVIISANLKRVFSVADLYQAAKDAKETLLINILGVRRGEISGAFFVLK